MVQKRQFDKPFLTAEWCNIVMLTYEIAPEVLQPYVPGGLELDLWEGHAFVTVVGLNFVTKKVFGLGFPLLPEFEQVNLRFYVRIHGKEKAHQGVVFIKEIVPRSVVSMFARLLFKQNYQTCPMSHRVEVVAEQNKKNEMIEYAWQHGTKWQKVNAHCQGEYGFPVKGSREEVVVERYLGYAQKGSKLLGFQVGHPPWKIKPAVNAELSCEVGKVYGVDFEPFLRTAPAFAFMAEGGAASLYYPYIIDRDLR